jgi:hypothetical protein
VVQAGFGDQFTPNLLFPYFVNPEASSIIFTFPQFVSWGGGVTLNGPVVTGIDDMITNVSVATNVVGWDNSRLFFTAHSVSVDWQNLTFFNSTNFTINLTSAPTPNTVPDDGSSMVLLFASLGGVFCLSRTASRKRLTLRHYEDLVGPRGSLAIQVIWI